MKDKKISHKCATHVEHETWGSGECISEQHTLDDEGNVSHYDVLFKHGIEENVAVEDLTINVIVEHVHGKRKMNEGNKDWNAAVGSPDPKKAEERRQALINLHKGYGMLSPAKTPPPKGVNPEYWNKGTERVYNKKKVSEGTGDAPINKMSHRDLADYIGKKNKQGQPHGEWVKRNRKRAEDMAHEVNSNTISEKMERVISGGVRDKDGKYHPPRTRSSIISDRAKERMVRSAMTHELKYNPRYKTEETEPVDEASMSTQLKDPRRRKSSADVMSKMKKDQITRVDYVNEEEIDEASLPPHVAAAQKKFDSQARMPKRPQAGTLMAAAKSLIKKPMGEAKDLSEPLAKEVEKQSGGKKTLKRHLTSGVLHVRNLKKMKEEVEQVDEETQLHRIGVTVSDPYHTMASKRKKTEYKVVRIKHDNEEGARRAAEKHFKNKGYKVHDSIHTGVDTGQTGIVKEDIEQMDENWRQNKANAAYGQLPQDEASKKERELRKSQRETHLSGMRKWGGPNSKVVGEENMQTRARTAGDGVSRMAFRSQTPDIIKANHQKTYKKLKTTNPEKAERFKAAMKLESTELEEKKLTPAEKKKREEIAKAMERENPGMPMGQKMAIATAKAKQVAEAGPLLPMIAGRLAAGAARKAGAGMLGRAAASGAASGAVQNLQSAREEQMRQRALQRQRLGEPRVEEVDVDNALSIMEEGEHFIMQLRRAQDLEGNHEVKFRKGSAKLPLEHINKALKAHDSLKPVGKRLLRVKLGHSPESFNKHIKEL